MDSAKLIPVEPALASMPLKQLNEIDGASEQKKEQTAKDFESLIINNLLNEMKDTIGDWGFERDGACDQVHGIFWFYLAQGLAKNGGFGLWKDMYQSLVNSDQTIKKAESLDNII